MITTPLHNLRHALRAPLWWNHLAPPVLAVFYFFLWRGGVVFYFYLAPVLLFLISFTGIAAFGYWLNDWMDIAADAAAGKPNAAASKSPAQRLMIAGALLISGWLPWLLLPHEWQGPVLLGLLNLALVLYSVPPFRWKERAFWGVVCDLSYGHLLPVFVALATFAPLFSESQKPQWLVMVLLFLLLVLKGMRNMLEHQISDRKNDRKAGAGTFVTRWGALFSARVLSWILLPLEMTLLSVFLASIGGLLFLSFMLFLAVYVFLFLSWKAFRGHPMRWLFRWWYAPNDFYEGWLPLTILVLAAIREPVNSLLLAVHLVIFPKSLQVPIWFFKAIRHVRHLRPSQ